MDKKEEKALRAGHEQDVITMYGLIATRFARRTLANATPFATPFARCRNLWLLYFRKLSPTCLGEDGDRCYY